MRVFNKDILDGIEYKEQPTVILHGCNCMHIMGAGVALYLRNKYPAVFDADKSTPQYRTSKLGTYSAALINSDLHILNCYTQFGIGVDKYGNSPVDYNAIRSCMSTVNKEYNGWIIRMPMIGCGLAGGDWEVVRQIIEDELGSQDVRVYLGARR